MRRPKLPTHGCYVLKPTFTHAAKELGMTATKIWRLSSTRFGRVNAHSKVRPIFYPAKPAPGHAFVVMLAYQISQYLPLLEHLDLTVEEGLHALTTLCLVEVSSTNAPSYHHPTPRDTIARFAPAPTSRSPGLFSLWVRVSTRKNCSLNVSSVI